jgi:hypothetical protein
MMFYYLPKQGLLRQSGSKAAAVVTSICSLVGLCHVFLHTVLPTTLSVEGTFVPHVLAVLFGPVSCL